MAKEEMIEFEGVVTFVLPDTRYRVMLDNGAEVIAYVSGKMKLGRIKVLTGELASDPAFLAAFRNEQVGFVFQDHHLLPQCTVLENVLVPTLAARGAGRDRGAFLGRDPADR